MANVLPREKQVAVISAIVEGVAVRSIERMTGVHRDTIVRLMVKVGEACRVLLDKLMVDLPCVEIEVDEIWGYVGRKQRNVQPGDDDSREVGDQWCFIALDPETKIVASFLVGKRSAHNTRIFIEDLARRLRNRVQISADAFAPYVDAIDQAFDCQVDFSQVIKSYETEPAGSGRYSPPRVSEVEKRAVIGDPNLDMASTSHVERQNLSLRLANRRMTRLTLSFSKNLRSHKASLALSFAAYNFCKVHRTLRVTPAMEANVTDHVWTIAELLDAVTP